MHASHGVRFPAGRTCCRVRPPRSRPSLIRAAGVIAVVCVAALSGTTAVRAQTLVPLSSGSGGSSGPGDAAPADSEPCVCDWPLDDSGKPGLVWRGRTSPTPDDMAAMIAPVLWFSPDEPLLTGEHGPVPGPAPCDRPSQAPIVYYQVVGIHLADGMAVASPIEREPDLFRKARGLVIKFFFYYPWDRGLSSHRHDLEAVDIDVELRQRPDGCREMRVRRVTGLAHGLSWYSNILKAERDMKLPIAMLVEEGKHAVCPDRNADGRYTPGYDVNARVRDAWGIRDVMAQGRVPRALNRVALAKPRPPGTRLLPPGDAPATCVTGDRRSLDEPEPSLGRYELRRADTVPPCPGVSDEPMLKMLRRTQRFGAEHEPMQYYLPLARELHTPEAPTHFVAGVAMRYDEGSVGASVMLRGFDIGKAWVVPRFGYIARAEKITAEALFTRSASWWLDPYVSVGYERSRMVLNRGVPLYPERSTMVTEAGVKFRLRTTGRARWATLGYSFGGVRIGVRANGFGMNNTPRVVFEIGPGVW